MKVAVIGAGISGLGAAYLLSRQHSVTLYEQANIAGGHSRTVDIPSDTGRKTMIPVDTGFIVFNDRTYPHLMGLFEELKVPVEKSSMSFGVSIDDGWLEYGSGHLFAQFRNFFRPAFWGMLFNILRFNRQATRFIDQNPDLTLGDCLDLLGLGKWFEDYYLVAMGAAIWSSPTSSITAFPAKTFIDFFHNHGLLTVNQHPQWYTVSGGSRVYIERLIKALGDHNAYIRLGCGVHHVSAQADTITIKDNQGGQEVFDHAVLACHADQALEMIDTPTEEEKKILGCFRYRENTIILHQDPAFMPKNKRCWSSWVYLSRQHSRENQEQDISLSYWMNNLQNLQTDQPVLVTLNPSHRPRCDCILDEHIFSHPLFDFPAINAQKDIGMIQGKRGLWFCGAYQGYGFHEDGLLSAIRVAQSLGASVPWRPEA